MRADCEAYTILGEKTAATPWQPPACFDVMPDARSRFFDASPVDDPNLPLPAPRLYAYQLPELPARDPQRFRSLLQDIEIEEQPTAANDSAVSLNLSDGRAPNGGIQPASYLAQVDDGGEQTPEGGETTYDELAARLEEFRDQGTELKIADIPQSGWNELPKSCLIRMLEFPSVRQEYERTFGTQPGPELRDHAKRLTLEDIVELAAINSREYQTQKERLYRAALGLTLDRYDYDLKFATSGNHTSADYTHDRDLGVTVNSLRIPSMLTADKLLATGGDIVARFANDVVLTFGGSGGFDADVGSAMLFEMSQSLFQRDIVLEGLTQAERDVVYAARDFARYRKTLFANLADQYYRLLLAYRAVEIDTRDYFSNLRGFEQGKAEFRFAKLPRYQVDQFEQQYLESGRRLISTCNNLEEQLDRLKLQIGLPPESPINLDLTELDLLTLRDEATAAIEGMRRRQESLQQERNSEPPSRPALINAAVNMTDDVLNYLDVRERLTGRSRDIQDLLVLRKRLKLEEARLKLAGSEEELDTAAGAAQPMKLTVLRRTLDVVDNGLMLISRQLDLAIQQRLQRSEIEILLDELARLSKDLDDQVNHIGRQDATTLLNEQDSLCLTAQALLDDTKLVIQAADDLLQVPPMTGEEKSQQTLDLVDALLAESQQFIDREPSGLTPLEIQMDDAMLTALTSRLDLMNKREQLADAWRRIKLTGDDLKSILNLRASHQLRTDPEHNRPFDFGMDDSTTRLTFSFDAPLNRRAQRNAYRRALIDYNAGLRSLIAMEDEIKLDVRDLLRSMQLNREQYKIAVASTALAYSRLLSTKLQLREGIGNVNARDVLESQRAYTESLTRLAAAHISYIQNRIQLFLDLEQLQVDEVGFWPDVYSEQLQPPVQYELQTYGRPVYGELPARVLQSHKIRRMLRVPPGETVIYRPQAEIDAAADPSSAPLATEE